MRAHGELSVKPRAQLRLRVNLGRVHFGPIYLFKKEKRTEFFQVFTDERRARVPTVRGDRVNVNVLLFVVAAFEGEAEFGRLKSKRPSAVFILYLIAARTKRLCAT